MNADVIAAACDALIKEDSAAPITRTALENIVGDIVKNGLTSNTVLDVKTSQNIIDWLLAVAVKYTQEAAKTHWNKKIERLPHVPKFITWAHAIWGNHLKGHENASFHHVERLFHLSRGFYVANETHTFLCAVLKDGLQRDTVDANEQFPQLNIWNTVGDLGMKSSKTSDYQQLYATYVQQRSSKAHWSTLGRLYLFSGVLDYVCNEQNASVREIIKVMNTNGYNTPLSTSELTQRLIAHAATRNEDIIKVLEDNRSPVIVELFKDTGFDLHVGPNQVWGIQQLDYLNKVPTSEFNASTMMTMWSTHASSTRNHSVTLALLSKISAYDIKNKIKVLVKDQADVRVDDIVDACLNDAEFLQKNPPEYFSNAAQVVLKKLENGALWSELSSTTHRAVFDQLTHHVAQVFQTPLNEKGVRVFNSSHARTLGSHIHIVHRSLRSNDNLITTEDALVAKQILLECPQINPQTQLMNMVKLVERGLTTVNSSDIDALQGKLNNICTPELLALASASVRPQAATSSKRRL